MKSIHFFGVLLAVSTLQAQTLNQGGVTMNPTPVNYVIGQQDANSQVWQKITQTVNARGNTVYQTNQAYVELATGLNHLVNGQWVASKEEIDILPGGSSAAGTNCQHLVYFPENIYSGSIRLMTPDGQTLESEPIGLAYFDGSNSVLLAVVTNSTGAILPSGNQVIYTNAFAGLNADIFFSNTKAGMSQDIVLRTQPPDPVALGLNPATTRLQMLTEFITAPQPTVTATAVPTDAGTLEDDYLSFGVMQMGHGKAFLIGSNQSSADVDKRWLTINGRQFLVEEVPIVSIATAIDSLPPYVAQAGIGIHPVVSKNLILPPQRLTHTSPKAVLLARAMAPDQGLVLDYQTINSSLTNRTFQGDTTYFINGATYLYGTNTFEGGTCLKFTNDASITLESAGTPVLNWLAGPYRPVIFTAKDDNSVGEAISGSSGSPTGYYANPALAITYSSPQTISNFRIAYARQAISVSGNSAASFYDGQIIDAKSGLALDNSTVYLRNVLFANLVTNFIETSSSTVDVQNATFNNVSYLAAEGANNALTMKVTNCVLANVTNLFAGAYTNGFSAGTNGFYNCPAFGQGQVTNISSPFQTVGAGNYYLASGCVFTNAGTTNIDPTLLADLQQGTVYPPLVISNVASSWTGTNLTPQVTRDLCNPPALGYHYDPLDYLVTGLSAFSDNNPILLTNSVAVGLFGNYGFVLNEVCKFVSVGKANAMNRIVWYPSVQEEPILLANIGTGGSGIFNVSGATSTALYIPKPQIILRFTDLPMLGTRQNLFYGFTYTYNVGTVSMQDCWARGISLIVGGYFTPYTNNTTAIFLLDNLFERSSVSLYNGYVFQGGSYIENPLSLTAYNNLFWNGSFGMMTYLDSQSWIHPNWTIKDNLFDTTPTSLNADGNWSNYVSTANNAYSGTSDIIPGTNDINPLTNLSYAIGPLGSWYINSASPTLLYAGSRSASSAGLYHYTIQTNEVVEATHTVSIGFHYVATDASGNPRDSNRDGIPDYLEDPNGNGSVDNGEYSWNSGVELSGPSLTYIVGSSPKPVDSAATIVAPNCSSLSNGSLTISISTNSQPEDTLAINNIGTGTGQVGITNNVVTYGGTNIGTFSGGNGSNALVINFTNLVASAAVVQAILQNVTYHYYPGTNESLSNRTVQFVLKDCGGYMNYPVTKTIHLGCPDSLNVMLVMDCSGSMSEFLGGSVAKLQAATNAAVSFVSAMQFTNNQRVGVVTFSYSASVFSVLTNNGSVTNIIASLRADGYTATSNGIALAQSQFPTDGPGTNALPVMILLTDGVPTDTYGVANQAAKTAAMSAANAAKQVGIRLVTIGLGTYGSTNFDPVLLTNLASSPDDCHIVTNTSNLQPVYAAIADSLCLQLSTNLTPNVSFISPTNSQLFVSSPLNIQLNAAASEPGGIISTVQFFNGTNLLGNGALTSSNTWMLLWTDVVATNYTLTAVATDGYGVTVTNSVSIKVNAMPVIYVATPTNLQSYTQITNVTLHAVANDPNTGGSIAHVAFYGAQTNLPYAVTVNNTTNFNLVWSNLTAGAYPIMAVATNNNGAVSWSSLVVFKVNSTNTPPTVVIAFPTNKAVIADGSDITITATVTPGTGTITNVEFFSNGQSLGSDPNSPYSLTVCCWKPGNYALTAIATDNRGMQALSAPVNITVANESPNGEGYWDPVLGLGASAIYLEGDTVVPGFDVGLSGTIYAGGENSQFPSALFQSANGTSWTPFYPDIYSGPWWAWYISVLADGTSVYGGVTYFNPGNAGYGPTAVENWNGTNSTIVGGNLPGGGSSIGALARIKGDLYIGGDFDGTGTGTIYSNIARIARFDAVSNLWVAVGNGLSNGAVYAIVELGGDVYIGGSFTNAGGNANVNYIAKLVGNTWTNLGTGVSGSREPLANQINSPDFATVATLAPCGTNLFVGGDFTIAGGNTNVDCIAYWNASGWHAMGRGGPIGVNPFYGPVSPHVVTVSPHGDRVFIGGFFDNIFDGRDTIPVNSVAMITWNEAEQTWTWSGLDNGVWDNNDSGNYGSFVSAEVFHSKVFQGSNFNQYDVYFSGIFDAAGESAMPSYGLARWRVGYPKAPQPPLVTLTSPAASAVFTNPAAINLAGHALSASTNIVWAGFYTNGVQCGNLIYPSSTTNYFIFTNQWNNPTNGLYLLVARASDANGYIGQSKPIVINIKTTNAVTAANEQYTIPFGTLAATFQVLTNCTPTSGLKISQVTQLNHNFGTANIGPGGTYILYTPSPNVYGSDFFYYSVTNASGASDSASVMVNIHPLPSIEILHPNNTGQFAASSNVLVSGDSFEYGGSITNVNLYVNGVLFGQTTNSTFSFNWSNTVNGIYTFIAVATDQDGFTNTSSPDDIIVFTGSNLITAAINNLGVPANSLSALPQNALPFHNSGLFDLQGLAWATNGTTNIPVMYQVLLCQADGSNTPVANITPQPDAAGFHQGGDVSGDLGVLDLTGVPNGVYDVALTVYGGGLQVGVTNCFILSSQLKLGQFSFSEQDFVLPVNGIPITITRTYNSQNTLSRDFGCGWSLAINSMDVELDEQRQDVDIGSDQVPWADSSASGNGLPPVISIRSGGGWDVTVTLPNGQRTTFAFSVSTGTTTATAQWKAPPWIHATLTPSGSGSGTIILYPWPYWAGTSQDGNNDVPIQNQDFPGWILTTQPDNTQYYLTRGTATNVAYQVGGSPVYARVYGEPQLSKIIQRSGDVISIGNSGISHYTTNNSTPTRALVFNRDGQGRITAIYDLVGGTNGLPVVQYVYDQDNGNLLQVVKLIDRKAGTYVTNYYRYDNLAFPHYITEIDNAGGVPVSRNYYDNSGRLIEMDDANGNKTTFIHNLTNNTDIVVDRLGRTNTAVYDTRGNVTATTNALNQVVLMAYDGNDNKTNQVVFANGQPYATNNFAYDPATSLLTAATDPLGHTSSFAYNSFGQLTQSTDANTNSATNFYDPNTGNYLGTSDALGNATTNFYSNGLLIGSRDSAGTLTTNFYDGSGNLTTSAALSASGAILSSNVFAYDANGNRTNSTVWRKVNGVWSSASTTYIFDAQNRIVQTIEPDGSTNGVVYDPTGRQQAVTDKLGHTTSYAYDFAGRLFQTTYPDNSTETFAYDAAGNRTNSVDRLGRTTTYVYDALNRLTQTIYPDSTSTSTIYDDLGRVKFSINARGITNAFGYDLDGRQISATNALGTAAQMVSTFGFDANGNQLYFTNAAGAVTTNVFDALNRQVQVLYPDGTKLSSGFDTAGRHVADTNQDGIVTLFGYDGAGQMISVTNALGKTEQTVTRYDYDETGDLIHQIDALNRTNTFAYDSLGRRILHTLPGGQSEGFAYDPVGNLIYQTNFNGVVITNQYDVMNRLTNVLSVNGYHVGFGYNVAGQRTNMTDVSGATSYTYDNRDRLTNKVVSWTSGPTLSLNYRFDADGSVTNLWSGSSGGVTNVYQFDALDRLTNVLANGIAAASYGFDVVGNLQSVRYGNGVTNQFQYDPLNRLTNAVWKLNASTLATFYYQLGLTGKRTNLSESVNSTSRTYGWTYDSLYRQKQEALGGGTSGTLSYSFDPVGNRTNRAVSGLSLTNQAFTFGTNDWLSTDQYDNNGNTTNSSGNFYQFDALNHLTNLNNGTALITYNGDGSRVKKTVGSTTTYYLLDDQNPSGYAQVLEEWTASGGTTNLSRVYNYGLQLISQRQPGLSTNYFVFDGHGSTRVLADIGGNVVNAFAFDAYGNLIASNAAPQTVYLYGGQQFDADLGQYYLRQRTYNPGTGRFWTADKKDADWSDPRTLHRYIYGADDPVGNVDPDGESFFAFDGTSNWEGESEGGVPTPTNVRKLYLASNDPDAHYKRGPGNKVEFHFLSRLNGNAFGYGMSRILRSAMEQLIEDRTKHNDKVVDIIGFSRGGIEAVEFANRVAEAFPDEKIRFVGLFDPVGSVGHPGGFGSYRHDLPAGITKAVEAFANDENRSWFPGTAVGGATITGFRGAHSDIGGGFPDHGLSDVTLVWMAAQAQSVNVSLDLSKEVQQTGIQINQEPNGTIHHVGGVTSIFTRSDRRVLSSVGSYTISDYMGN